MPLNWDTPLLCEGSNLFSVTRNVLPGGRGQLVFVATEIARTMIIAIMTSREAEPGKSKWLTNNDLAKSFSWTISQTIPNKTVKKQKIHGILFRKIQCLSKTKHFKAQKHSPGK